MHAHLGRSGSPPPGCTLKHRGGAGSSTGGCIVDGVDPCVDLDGGVGIVLVTCTSTSTSTSTSASTSTSCWDGTAVGGIDHPECGTIGHDIHHRGGRTTFAGRGSTVCGAWGAGAAVTTAMVGTIVGVSARACPTRRCPTRAWRRTARAWFVRTSGGATSVPSVSVRHCS